MQNNDEIKFYIDNITGDSKVTNVVIEYIHAVASDVHGGHGGRE